MLLLSVPVMVRKYLPGGVAPGPGNCPGGVNPPPHPTISNCKDRAIHKPTNRNILNRCLRLDAEAPRPGRRYREYRARGCRVAQGVGSPPNAAASPKLPPCDRDLHLDVLVNRLKERESAAHMNVRWIPPVMFGPVTATHKKVTLFPELLSLWL